MGNMKYASQMVKSLREYRYKQIIPFIFTFANALLGMLSILKTFEGEFIKASWCIIGAVIVDGIDGRLARYFGTQGQLGGELDSLCDAISFCLAPAVLLYTWYKHDDGTHTWLLLSAASFYLCAGLFRLARFNTTTTDQSIFYFGFPTTLAAFFLVQFICYQRWIQAGPFQFVFHDKVLFGIIIFVSLLMISSLKFPVFKKTKLPMRQLGTYLKVGALIGCVGWTFYHDYPLFLILLAGYIVGTLLFNGASKVQNYRQHKKRPE